MRPALLVRVTAGMALKNDPEDSGESQGRRAAVKLGEQPPGAGGVATGDTRIDSRSQGGPMGGFGGCNEHPGDGGGNGAGKLGAARRGFDGEAGAAGLGRVCLRVHGAMMGAAAAAAERQACVAAPWQQSGNGREPEKNNQRNGERSTHGTRFTIMPSLLEAGNYKIRSGMIEL